MTYTKIFFLMFQSIVLIYLSLQTDKNKLHPLLFLIALLIFIGLSIWEFSILK